MYRRRFSSLRDPRNANSTPPSHDNPKYLQTLPNVPRGHNHPELTITGLEEQSCVLVKQLLELPGSSRIWTDAIVRHVN